MTSSSLPHSLPFGWNSALALRKSRMQTWRIDEEIEVVNASLNAVNETIGYELDPLVETFNVLLTCVLAFVMFGLGCAVDYGELRRTLKRPVGICVGLSCQIFMMPLISYCLVKATQMPDLQALSFMAVGSSPGGLISNIITMMIQGDMALSMALTSLTNIIAFGSVPFWLYVFSAIEDIHEDIRIPFSSLGISLTSLVIPIIFGVLFRMKRPELAKSLTKRSAVIGFIIIIAISIVIAARNEVPLMFTPETVTSIIILPVAGMGLSFALTFLPYLHLTEESRKTIAVETSIQNSSLSTNIVLLTYAPRVDIFAQVITTPLMYSGAQTIFNVLIVCLYKGFQIRKKRQLDLEVTPATSREAGVGT